MSAMPVPQVIMFNQEDQPDPHAAERQEDEAQLREIAKSAGIRPMFMTQPRT